MVRCPGATCSALTFCERCFTEEVNQSTHTFVSVAFVTLRAPSYDPLSGVTSPPVELHAAGDFAARPPRLEACRGGRAGSRGCGSPPLRPRERLHLLPWRWKAGGGCKLQKIARPVAARLRARHVPLTSLPRTHRAGGDSAAAQRAHTIVFRRPPPRPPPPPPPPPRRPSAPRRGGRGQ